MKTKPLAFALLTGLAIASSASAAVTLVDQYHLGEAGSLSGTTQLPQDSVGTRHFTGNQSGGTATVGTTGVSVPGSTAYLNTSNTANSEGWHSADYTGFDTDNFGFGIYVNAAANTAATQGDVFTLGNANGAYALTLYSTGWVASAKGVAFIGSAGTFTADEWVHLAIIRSEGVSTFYMNGVAQGTGYGVAPVQGLAHLSANPGGATYYDGKLDEARVITFTSGESTANILNALAVPEPSSALLGGLGMLALLRRRRA